MTTKIPSLRERQRREREALIQQAAMELLLERGYHEMSMDEIAHRVGISKGTVYLHFPSKEDLLLALIVSFTRQFVDSIRAIIQSESTPRAKLEGILQNVFLNDREQKMRVFALVNENEELRTVLRTRCDPFQASYREINDMLTTIFDDGKADGTFSADIPTSILIAVFSMFLSPRHLLMMQTNATMNNGEYLAHMYHVLFHGIANNQSL